MGNFEGWDPWMFWGLKMLSCAGGWCGVTFMLFGGDK